jgi:hypothetical protein
MGKVEFFSTWQTHRATARGMGRVPAGQQGMLLQATKGNSDTDSENENASLPLLKRVGNSTPARSWRVRSFTFVKESK